MRTSLDSTILTAFEQCFDFVVAAQNETKRSAARSWKMKRNAKLPRHSKNLFPNLRMASPLWMWGWPKISVSSHNASRHSTFSVLGSSRSRRITAGSMVRAFANHLPELFGRDGNQFSRAFELPVASVRGLFQVCDLFRRCPVFALRIVRRFYRDSAQGDDVRPADNPDVFAAGGGGQPPAEILLCVSDRESLHLNFIKALISLVKTANRRSISVKRRPRNSTSCWYSADVMVHEYSSSMPRSAAGGLVGTAERAICGHGPAPGPADGGSAVTQAGGARVQLVYEDLTLTAALSITGADNNVQTPWGLCPGCASASRSFS